MASSNGRDPPTHMTCPLLPWVRVLITPNEAGHGLTCVPCGWRWRQAAGEVMAYFLANNYIVADNQGSTVT
jgi:hypothetical protein